MVDHYEPGEMVAPRPGGRRTPGRGALARQISNTPTGIKSVYRKNLRK